MSHYERRLQADLQAIRERVAALGAAVQKAVADAVVALLAGDRAASYSLALHDLPINRDTRALDAACHAFVARHLPAAGHLRFVSSVLRLSVGLERIGDYAVTICREAVQLSKPPPDRIAADIRVLAEAAGSMLGDAIHAFVSGDAELARDTRRHATSIDRTYDEVFADLVGEGSARPLADLFALLAVLSKLERVSDQAKNVCEEAVFAVTGRTKPPKVYSILFLDADNALYSQLAEAIARRSFPCSGSYSSAGVAPAERVSPELGVLAETLSLDAGGARPKALAMAKDALAGHHVIVGLNLDPVDHVTAMPFATVALRWDLPETPADAARALNAKVSDLMVLMRGEDAP